MTESQINYFLTAAKEKSISKASETLFVSQPAVSKQIALLETELGCPLFTRHTKGLELTPAGMAFEKLFLEFRKRFRETVETYQHSENSLSGKYILGAFDGWRLSEFCLDLFEKLSLKYPLVDFEVRTYSVDQIIYALRHGEVNDILATEAILLSHKDLVVDHICSIQSLLLYSSRHPMAQKKDLTLSDFSESTFFVTSSQNLTGGISNVLLMCNDAGFTPVIKHLPSLSAVRNNLQATNGVFITNEWIIDKENPVFGSITLPYNIDIAFGSLKDDLNSPFHVVRKDILSYYHEKFS